MAMDFNFDSWLNRYLDNDFTKLEEQRFFQELDNNPMLKKEFEAQLLCNKAFAHLADAKLRNQLAHTEAEMQAPQKHWLYKHTVKLASLTGVLIILASILLLNPSKNSPQEIFSEHFQAYENLYTPILRSSTKTDPGTIQHIMDHYENGKFEEATKLYESDFQDYRNNIDLRFYMGIAYLGLNNTERAIDLLSSIPVDSKYTAISQWYLGLSYLLNEEYKQAKHLLMNVQYNQEEAKKIIEEMEF